MMNERFQVMYLGKKVFCFENITSFHQFIVFSLLLVINTNIIKLFRLL